MSNKDQKSIVKQEYGQLFDEITRVLFEEDFMGISCGDNFDEYDLEAATIIPRLHTANSVKDVQRIVHEEFQHWFGKGYVGKLKCYKQVSLKIWKLWCEWQLENQAKS
jgi:hypothetical protein